MQLCLFQPEVWAKCGHGPAPDNGRTTAHPDIPGWAVSFAYGPLRRPSNQGVRFSPSFTHGSVVESLAA
jgi:hypothetical protein